MADVYTSTNWHVTSGREDEFVQLWRDALTWTKENHGGSFERARLLLNNEDAGHFVSFIEWDDREGMDRWSDDPEKQRRQRALEGLCSEMRGSTYGEATRVG